MGLLAFWRTGPCAFDRADTRAHGTYLRWGAGHSETVGLASRLHTRHGQKRVDEAQTSDSEPLA